MTGWPGSPGTLENSPVSSTTDDDPIRTDGGVRSPAAELERTERTLKRMQEFAGCGSFAVDVDSDELLDQTGIEAVLGLDPDDLESAGDVLRPVPAGERATVAEQMAIAMETCSSFEWEHRYRIDGEIHWIRATGEVTEADNRTIMRGVFQDVTDQKEYDRRLERAHDRMELALEATKSVVWECDFESGTVRTHPDPHPLLETGMHTLDDFYSGVLEEDLPRVREAIDEAIETGEPYRETYRMRGTNSGEVRWVDVYGEVVDVGGDTAPTMIGVTRDVTGQKSRERELQLMERRLSIALEAANAGVWEWDPVSDDVIWHETLERQFALQPGEFAGTLEAFFQFLSEEEQARLEAQLDAAVPERKPVEIEFTVGDGEATRWWYSQGRFVEVEGLTPRYVGIAQDITQRKEHERTLAALHKATATFVEAGTKQQAAESIVETMAEVADLSNGAVYLYDETDGVLRPAAASESGRAMVGDLPEFGPGEGIAWEVFTSGESVVYDDLRAVDRRYNPQTNVRSEVVVSMGDQGVLLAGDTRPGVFDERTRELAEIVAAVAESALISIEQAERLRDQSAQLRQQTTQLDRLNELNRGIRRINRTIVTADTHEEIHQAVCDQLASLEPVEFVWFGVPDPDSDGLVPAAYAGDEDTYLDAVYRPVSQANPIEGPAERALSTEDATSVPVIASEVRAGQWQSIALQHGYRSVISIPVSYRDSVYGVVTLFSTDPEAFSETGEAVLSELTRLVGLAINAIDRKAALFGKRKLSVELAIERSLTSAEPFLWLAGELDCQIDIQNVVPNDGAVLVYAQCHGVTGQAVQDAVDELAAIASVRRIRGTDPCDSPPCLFEFHATDGDILTRLAGLGVRVRSVIADGDGGRLIGEFPSTVDPTDVADRLQSTYPGLAVESTDIIRDTDGISDTLSITDPLTQAQQAALAVAFESGYFEWPRDSTSQEIADSLGISQPAYSQRLRGGLKKLVGSYARGLRVDSEESP